MKNQKGFTLIELMIVVAIIGIMATMALPSFQERVIRNQVKEGLNLADFVKEEVEDYYKANGKMPADNTSAGLPPGEKIIGNFVTGIEVENGTINIKLGNRINKNAAGKKISVRPAIVKGAPKVPIAWVHGYASVPEGMTVIGENKSDILKRLLPMNCRY